jgi:DUF971 family protein
MKLIIIFMMGSFLGAFAQDLTSEQQVIIDQVEEGARNRAQIVSQYASSNVSFEKLNATTNFVVQLLKDDEFKDPVYTIQSAIRKIYDNNQKVMIPMYQNDLAELNACREARGKLLIAPSSIIKEYSQTNENGEILTADFMQFSSLEYDDLGAQYIDEAYNASLIIDLINSTRELKDTCLKILEANNSRVVIQPQGGKVSGKTTLENSSVFR